MNSDAICAIIGASHAGVNCAFALRRYGWLGKIVLYDQHSHLPYHKPPLSKAFLSSDDDLAKHLLKPVLSYEKENITLALGDGVVKIDPRNKQIQLSSGDTKPYHKLVIATGARPLLPPIPGLVGCASVFSLRRADDALAIRKAFQVSGDKRVVIVGGGYIGLEVAASLQKLGGAVTVLEREDRVLARVTAPEMSLFFEHLHTRNGVNICTRKTVSTLDRSWSKPRVLCAEGDCYDADLIVIGIGIRVNQELATEAGLEVDDGILVNEHACTSKPDIYAVGDCTKHYNAYYDRWIRLESVQNAVDQAKIAAANICGKNLAYDALPWFWSDQYDVKFQSVGLSVGYDEAIVREEKNQERKHSVWYFNGDDLLAVDAANHPKAYVLGTKILKGRLKINRHKLSNPDQDLVLANILAS